MLTESMICLLECPTCFAGGLKLEGEEAGAQRVERGTLVCDSCSASFPVQHGVPDLVPGRMLDDGDWKLWRDHIEGLQARREQRTRGTRSWSDPTTKEAFAKFVDPAGTRLLDVGCGAGKFRRYLADGVEYYGLDPVPVPETTEFPYVRALAERIPFRDSTFSDLVVIASVDHFQDIGGFLSEAVRVLEETGRFHLVQSVHGARGLAGRVRMLAHHLKDSLESRATKVQNPDAPKHMTEFTRDALEARLSDHFRIDRVAEHAKSFYHPLKLFLTMSPR
jgi:SAM-dependent methyltransferase